MHRFMHELATGYYLHITNLQHPCLNAFKDMFKTRFYIEQYADVITCDKQIFMELLFF